MRADILEIEPFGGMKLEVVDVQYALFLCLQYVCETEEVTEMLIYVLLSTAAIAENMDAQEKVFDVIDCMAEVISKDYEVKGQNGPMDVFGLLDKGVRRVLFENMIEPAGTGADGYEVVSATKQLAEHLTLFRTGRIVTFDEAEEYLRQSGRYFERRFLEILSRIVSIWLSAMNTSVN
jgi:hypothetical protein